MKVQRIVESVKEANKLLANGWVMLGTSSSQIEEMHSNAGYSNPIASWQSWTQMGVSRIFVLELIDAEKCTYTGFHDNCCDGTGFIKKKEKNL